MDLRHVNFRLLEVFTQVVEHQSISSAARQLHLTQPTISAQIKRLEDICATKILFQRGRQMLPTIAGEELYKAAGDTIRRMQECGEKIAAIESGVVGELTIALVNTAQYVVPQLVAEFNRFFPDIQVKLRIGNREATLQRYFRNKDDLYIFSHPPTDSNADAQAFMRNQLVLIAPKDHWAVQQAEIDFYALRDERFLVREPGSATAMVLDTWLAGQGVHLSQRVEVESNEAIRVSVAAGSGLAVLSEHIVEHGNDPVSILKAKGFPLPGQWYLVSRKDNLNQRMVNHFREIALRSNLPAER